MAGSGLTCEYRFHLEKVSANDAVGRSASPLIRRYGRLVLELDTITPTASPCGADCEFDFQFEGPYLQCNTSTTNVTQGFLPADTCPLLAFDTSIWSEGSRNVFGAFNMSVTSDTGLTSNRSVWQTFHNLTCMPSRASYDAHAVYRGGNLSVSHTEEYIGSLTDMNHLIDGYYPVTPQCDVLLAANGSGTDAYYDCVEYEPAQWSEPLRQVLTSLNHFALIDSVISPLAGNYSMSTSGHFTAGAGSFTACGKYREDTAEHPKRKRANNTQDRKVAVLSLIRASTCSVTTSEERPMQVRSST